MKFIPNGVTTKVARTILKSKKNSPTLMFGAGVIGMIGTAVLASKATLKLDESLEEINKKMDSTKEYHTTQNAMLDGSSYSENDYHKDMGVLYVRSATQIGKLYLPAIVVGVVSVGLLTGSHITLTRRNVAVTAAYAALEKGFSEYRGRVLAEYGPEKDRELRYGYEVCEIEDEKGKKKEVKRIPGDAISEYGRFFGPDSSSWSSQPEYNLLFLRAQQQFANDRLMARGHVFLNEIYDALGMERSPAGAVVGWVKGNGDDCIDFGIFDSPANDRFYEFVTGREGIWLDFNVDGVIYTKI